MKALAAGFFAVLLSLRIDAAMVVSSHALGSQAGVDVLKSGGNAIDAAIATGMALAVVHPSAGNIGGGGFMIVFTKSGDVTTFDFREKAPAAAREKMFLDANGELIKDLNHEGYLAVGVPGTVAGFDLARKRFGTKSWTALAAPAVKLASEGFFLSESMAKEFARRTNDWKKHPASAKVFLQADGSPFKSGDLWKQADLAKALQRIQQQGRAGFYSGETARLIADDMRRNSGLITESDLASYEAKERKPVRGTYRGFEVYSMPPPSSGGIALIEMLNIIETRYVGPHNSADYLHLLAEAMRRAFADRAEHIGDPDFNPDIPVARLISKEHAAKLRATIDPQRASVSDAAKFAEAFESDETTHYSVIDDEGNAVVVTYTLEYSYGSRIVADGLGFLYNNEMGDFNPQPGRTDSTGLIGAKPNLVAPGKRMLSSMTPTIVARDGKPFLLIGTPGGRTIINTVLQVTLNVLDFNMSIADAVAAPRIHHQWLPDRIQHEPGIPEEALAGLRARGHKLDQTRRIGEAMGITTTPVIRGAADPRSADGRAIGY